MIMKKNFTSGTDFYGESVRSAFRLNNPVKKFLVHHLPGHTYLGLSTILRIHLLFGLKPNRRRILTAFCLAGSLFSFCSAFAQNPPPGFSSSKVGSDWDQPVGLTFAKDGRMFVW